MKNYRTILLLIPLLCSCVFSTCTWAALLTDMGDFTLLSGGDLLIGRDSYIDGNIGAARHAVIGSHVIVNGSFYTEGTLAIGKNSQVGSLDSGADALLGKDSHILGNLTYGGQLWAHHTAVIEGSVSNSTSGWTAPALSAPSPSTSGVDAVTVTSHASETLSPGDYGSLTLGHSATLSLSPGVYNLSELHLDRDASILADTSGGEVILNIAATMDGDSSITLLGQGQHRLTIHSGSDLAIGSFSVVDADLFSFGTLSVGRNGNLAGHFYGDSGLYLDHGVQLATPTPQTAVEPATVLLLTGGASMLTIRRGR